MFLSSSLLCACRVFIATSIVATLSAAAADESPAKAPAGPLTLYVLRVFTVSKAEGLELLARDLDDRALHKSLIDQAKTTPAVLEKLLLVASNNSDKVELQQANELIYPTEFDPQQIPTQLAIGDAALLTALQKFFQPPAPPTPNPISACGEVCKRTVSTATCTSARE